MSILKHTQFNLQLLSTFRLEIMGCATLMILLCHAVPNGCDFGPLFNRILLLGNEGVDIFLILSGMSMFYSLDRNKDSHRPLSSWYLHRFTRLLFPYFFICGTAFLCEAIYTRSGIYTLLMKVLTVSFWINHQGAWFVALLIPIYILCPLIYRLLEKTDRFRILVLILASCLLLWLCSIDYEESPYLFEHSARTNLQFAFRRSPAFLLGMTLGPYIKGGKSIPLIIAVLLPVCLYYLMFSYAPDWCRMTVIAIPLMVVLAFVFNILNGYFRHVKALFSNLGTVSLESYLFNITIPYYFVLGFRSLRPSLTNSGVIVSYVFSLIIGILLSFCIKRLFNYISRAHSV